MDPNISKHLMTSPLKANDLAGLTPEQIMSVTQSGAQQRGQVASMLDAAEGRKLQRKQQEQMERQYKHQREMSEKQFELLQRQDVRQQFNEMFSMGLQMGQRKIEQRKLQLNEQLQNAQLQNNSVERKKLDLELGQLLKKQEMLNGVEGDMQIGPDFVIPKLMAVQNPALLKVGLDYNLAMYKAKHDTDKDLPAAIQERNANAELISWGAEQNLGVEASPEAAKADAVVLDFYSNLSDPTQTLKIAGDSTALMSKMFDTETREELVQTLVSAAENNLARILQGNGPNVQADLARRGERLPATQGLQPADVSGLTDQERGITDMLLESVRKGIKSPEMAQKYVREAFKNGEVSENVVRSFEGAFRNAVEDIQNPETETETEVETDVPDSDVNVENEAETETETPKPKPKTSDSTADPETESDSKPTTRAEVLNTIKSLRSTAGKTSQELYQEYLNWRKNWKSTRGTDFSSEKRAAQVFVANYDSVNKTKPKRSFADLLK